RPLGGHAAMVLGDHSEHRRREPARSSIGAYLADVDGDDRATRLLDPLDHLALDGERPDEPVEVGDDDHVGLAGLDALDRLAQAVTPLERGTAGDVRLVERRDERQPVASAGLLDTLGLLARRNRIVAEPGDTDDTDSATQGGLDGR